jgi:hypothetical protein
MKPAIGQNWKPVPTSKSPPRRIVRRLHSGWAYLRGENEGYERWCSDKAWARWVLKTGATPHD